MNRDGATTLRIGVRERGTSEWENRAEWWDNDKSSTERDDARPRHWIALAQLVVGVLIAAALIVHLAT